MEIVRLTISLLSQPSLTEKELGRRAMDWQDVFEGEIPADRLHEAYKAALKVHESSFPVNAFEVLAAWRGMRRHEPIDQLDFQERLMNQNGTC